ncbi:DDE superfamily endonuclease, partial [Mesorhizobium tianshanense]
TAPMSAACCTALGSATKKTLQASEQQRADIREARDLWIRRRKHFFNKALPRLVFIDETSTNTKLTKRTGWSPKGERYRTHAPFGQWKTQTFIAGLRCHGMIAPWIVDAPMNGLLRFAMRLLPRLVKRARHNIARFGADPGLLAAMLAAELKHGVEHSCRDALALKGRRHPDFIDVEFAHLVRMAVDDGRALPDDRAVEKRHDHEMTWRGKIGGKAIGPHRFVEHVLGDPRHKGVVARK